MELFRLRHLYLCLGIIQNPRQFKLISHLDSLLSGLLNGPQFNLICSFYLCLAVFVTDEEKENNNIQNLFSAKSPYVNHPSILYSMVTDFFRDAQEMFYSLAFLGSSIKHPLKFPFMCYCSFIFFHLLEFSATFKQIPSQVKFYEKVYEKTSIFPIVFHTLTLFAAFPLNDYAFFFSVYVF